MSSLTNNNDSMLIESIRLNARQSGIMHDINTARNIVIGGHINMNSYEVKDRKFFQGLSLVSGMLRHKKTVVKYLIIVKTMNYFLNYLLKAAVNLLVNILKSF